jgi:sugar/nucleoside kinase (ribokinase family)
MKIAVLGPVTKDYIKIDGKLTVQIGGIPYYIALALKNLGVKDVVSYITYGQADEKFIVKNFQGLKIEHISAKHTLESYLEYSISNPDERKVKITYHSNIIKPKNKLIKELSKFDYVILGPLFHDNIPFDLFFKLKNKNLVYGNFGIFTYIEKGKFVRKNPENLIKVLPYLKYLFLDDKEAKFVSGKKTIKEMAKFFRKNGLNNLIITQGSRGSHIFIGRKYYSIPAFAPKKIIDTTGAGDTYLAAFIRAIELFNNPLEWGRFAAMVATISLEKKGAFSSNLNNTLKRLKQLNKL